MLTAKILLLLAYIGVYLIEVKQGLLSEMALSDLVT